MCIISDSEKKREEYEIDREPARCFLHEPSRDEKMRELKSLCESVRDLVKNIK